MVIPTSRRQAVPRGGACERRHRRAGRGFGGEHAQVLPGGGERFRAGPANPTRVIRCYPVGMSTEELLAQVLGLPRRERARVVEEVLASLEEPEEDVARAWASEL